MIEEYIIPKRDNITLGDSFYVRMTKHYVATVRNLKSLVAYLESGDIDETFGEITKVSSEHNSGNFYHHLINIIGHYKERQMFNACVHQFVQLNHQKETVSIRMASGREITVCVMEDAECIDIQYHDSDLPKLDNGGSQIPQFQVIGFGLGDTPVKPTAVTLATIKL